MSKLTSEGCQDNLRVPNITTLFKGVSIVNFKKRIINGDI